ncbi:MAG TPA: MMPL family transporter [Thermoleophilaceae bacterium]|jgi:RND superfamily putative drug exporter
MISLAKLSVRRPKASLAAWLIVGVALALIGFNVSKSLSPTITVVPGTQSARAEKLAGAKFGPTQLVPILLEGPKAQLNRQGPALVAELAKRPHTRVLSAWDAGTASAGLRPKPTAAMIVVSVDRSESQAVKHDQPQIEKLVAQKITSPVSSHITGQPAIDRAERHAALSDLRRNELIAVGILFVLLLIGLRAPVAALVVTAVGAVSVLAGFGEVALLSHIYKIDPVDIAGGTMIGLGLAVAFSLLILDRFHREELPPGAEPRTAASAAIRGLESTSKAVLVAGTAFVVALLLVSVVGPTELMNSVGTSALVCGLFATGGAVVVLPAAFVLLGRRLDAFSFPAPPPLARLWASLVSGGNWVTRHAVYAGFAATALLAVIAVPAFGLDTGPTDIRQLPANSKARTDFEEISRVMGPGWATPYSMIVVANDRPITTPAVLNKVYGFEKQIAQNKTVDSVTGPGAINPISNELKSFGPGLQGSVKLSDQSKKDLLKLAKGLGLAGSGSAQLQSGLEAASSGAGQLHSGGGKAQSGAGQLHTGLAQAKAGSAKLEAGLNQALSGAQALKKGSGQVLSGSNLLVNGLGQLQNGAKPVVPGLNALAASAATTNSQTDKALAELNAMTSGKSDPNYAAVQQALQAASSSATSTSSLATVAAKQAPALVQGIDQLNTGAGQLQAGIQKLHNGNAQLASGIDRLAGGGSQLTGGLGQLTAGAGALQIGLGQLTTGAGQLASGLGGGVGPAGQLTTGLGTMQAAVVKSRGKIPSTAQLKQLFAQSPGMFNSGYFVLAAVEGATPADRNAATFTINLLRGGTAGQIVVVSKYNSSDSRTAALGTTLSDMGGQFAKANNLQVAVGGPAGSLGDLTSVTKSKIWIDVAVVAAALLLVLALALRAVLLPIVSTAFTLLVVAASFGVMELLFGGSNPPLGGPGHLDPVTIISVFTAAFALSTVFTTILLMRTREEYVSTPGNRHAVRVGLRETAAATTGAGLLMVAALIPFSTSDFIVIRALGVGIAVAVLLDVVLVRPVLLPAAEAVLGRYGWWPTTAPSAAAPPASESATTDLPRRRLPRPRLRHRPPGPAS